MNSESTLSIQSRERLSRWYQGAIAPGRATPLDLLVIQGTRFCNLDCRYCYLPKRSDKQTFDIAMFDKLLPAMLEAGLISDKVTIAWHAGEPLVLGPDYYKFAFDKIQSLMGDVKVEHHFQTNAVLITDSFCEFIKANEIRMGVSIDGPAPIHDANRVNRNGKPSHHQAMEGVRRLQEHEIPFSAICVLSAPSLSQPDEIYDFFKENGFHNIGFNIEEIEGIHRVSSLQRNLVSDYRTFLARVFERATTDNFAIDIREFRDGLSSIGSIFGKRGAPVSNENNPFSILSVDVEGNIYTFSPELVDLRDEQDRSFSIGHVNDVDFVKIVEGENYLRLAKPISEGVTLCRQTCSYFDVCGGGAPVNKLAENGTFVSTETLRCKLDRQTLIDVLEDELASALEKRRQTRALGPMVQGRVRTTPNFARALLSLPDLGPLRGRLQRSSGTRDASEEDFPRYERDARIPREDWGAVSEDEWKALRQPSIGGPFAYASLVRFPPHIGSQLGRLRERLMRSGNFTASPEAAHLLHDIARLLGVSPDSLQLQGAMHQTTAGPTGTLNPRTGELLGLHIDSWSELAPQERFSAPNRLCINLGDHARHLLFLRPLITQMIDEFRDQPGQALPANLTNMARLYMKSKPDTLVYRLSVEPGEAYVAPTEMIVHDGSATVGTEDALLTIFGHLRYEQIRRISDFRTAQNSRGLSR